MEEIITEKHSFNISDGTSMASYCAKPKDDKKHPGIIVFQEAFGVNRHIKDITQRFARLGFISIAPELFHRTAHEFEGSYDNFEGVRQHVQAVMVEGLIKDTDAVYRWLMNNPQLKENQIASVGYCLGGKVSFLANTSFKLNAAISYYGGGMTALLEKADNIQAPQLMFWGGLDKHIDDKQISAVINALKENNKKYVNVIFSEAGHGFNCDVRASFNSDASKQAWALAKEFLNTYISF